MARKGQNLQVVQRDGDVFVLNRDTGVLTRIDSTLLGAAGATKAGTKVQVLPGTGRTYLVDPSGKVDVVDSKTLARIGAPVMLPGSPPGRAVVDSGGTLWVPIPSRASCCRSGRAVR